MSKFRRHPMKVWKELILDENDKTVASISTVYRTEAEVEHYVKLFMAAPEMLEGLQAIARKAPHLVSREEAADMAIEFHTIAKKLVERVLATREDEFEAGVV